MSAVANLMQCVLALSSSVSGPEGTPLLLFDLKHSYPTLEPQGPLPDVLRRVVSTYEMVNKDEFLEGIYIFFSRSLKFIKKKSKIRNNKLFVSINLTELIYPPNKNLFF